MAIRRLSRRTFLRGVGGIAVALPALEIMMPTRQATAGGSAPTRYVVAFCGASTGRRDGNYTEGDATGDLLVPDALGPNYDVKRALTPLSTHDLVGDVSILSGMLIPWDQGSGIPEAGRRVQFHESSLCPLLSGMRGHEGDGDDDCRGPTSDQIVGNAIGMESAHRVLPVCVQAASYRGGSGGSNGTLSYREDGDIQPVAPIVSPRQLFESLFAGFVPPGADPEQLAELEYQSRRTHKVVDLVKDDADRLISMLGGEDRQRMERHLTALSEFETSLDQDGSGGGNECLLPRDPGDDPSIGNSTSTSSAEDYDTTAAWSDEETRAARHTELIHMALTCDLTRSVALMYTYAHCWLNMFPSTGHTNDLHELGHGSSGSDASPLEALSDGIAWNVGHWARLVDMLKNTPDIDGRSVLDNTAISLVFEGGHGYDPEADANSVHSTENMSALIAGGAGGLNPNGGQHISVPGEHPARVLTSAMSAVGAGDTLGEVSGVIPELFA